MNIVFLDIDGVLNHSGTAAECAKRRGKSEHHDWIDPACVARLDVLCAIAKAKIVISSSWRGFFVDYEEIVDILRRQGLKAEVIGATPMLSDDRWAEISAWLRAHPKVTRWVILDDTPFAGFPSERFVRTNIEVGLTDADVDRAISILLGAP